MRTILEWGAAAREQNWALAVTVSPSEIHQPQWAHYILLIPLQPLTNLTSMRLLVGDHYLPSCFFYIWCYVLTPLHYLGTSAAANPKQGFGPNLFPLYNLFTLFSQGNEQQTLCACLDRGRKVNYLKKWKIITQNYFLVKLTCHFKVKLAYHCIVLILVLYLPKYDWS